MKKYIFTTFLYLFVFAFSSHAQVEKLLVYSDRNSISEMEFKKQFELSPMVYNTTDVDEKKRIFLISMASAKLWAAEAEEMSPYSNPLIKYSLSEIEKKLMRDVLYKKEIESKVQFTSGELAEAKNRYKIKLDVLFITSQSKTGTEIAYKKLQEGISLDSLGLFVKDIQINRMNVGYGDMFETYENILYALRPGEYSQPLLTEAGHTIFYLLQKNVDIEKASLPEDRLTSSAKSLLEKHKIKEIYQDFNKIFLGNVKVTADVNLFNSLTEKLAAITTPKIIDDTSGVSLSFYDIFGLTNRFTENELNSPFIKFEQNPVTLMDFLGSLGFEGLKLPGDDLRTIKNIINGWIKNYIRLELLAREAQKRGFETHPEVVSELQMWKDNYFATYAIQQITKEVDVTEAEISEYLTDTEREGFSGLYKIFGLSTTSIEKVNILLESLDKDENFINSVKKLKSGSDIYIDHDYVPLHETDELSVYVQGMKEGEVFGPLETDGRYSVFQLVDIKKMETSINSEAFRKGAESRIYNRKLEKIIEEKTIELAKKYNLEVNTELLKNIKVNDINIVVMRSFGFGEKMLAAPMIQRNFEWFKRYLEEKSESL
ncbi:MAG: hypothetical protein SCALA702_22250 [Melioribacteraceae bacterium]|nr:MAG: hypothetical protein SCALA702_22250 [Melioribacteraceae bacterium]